MTKIGSHSYTTKQRIYYFTEEEAALLRHAISISCEDGSIYPDDEEEFKAVNALVERISAQLNK